MDQQLNRPGPTPASEPVSRRGVLRAATVSAAAVGAAGLLGGPAVAAPTASTGQAQGRRRVPVDRISIQLYTLRDQLAADLPGTLDALVGSATGEWSTPVSSDAPPRSSGPRSTRPGCVPPPGTSASRSR